MFFFGEIFFHACHINCFFRYHKHYTVLHVDKIKNFTFFLSWLFLDLLATSMYYLPLALAKKFFAFSWCSFQDICYVKYVWDKSAMLTIIVKVIIEIITIKKSIFAKSLIAKSPYYVLFTYWSCTKTSFFILCKFSVFCQEVPVCFEFFPKLNNFKIVCAYLHRWAS